ncbi:MAG: hypothetical protein ACTTIA_06400, partial [Candidatus Cryptobacteroides sp.]
DEYGIYSDGRAYGADTLKGLGRHNSGGNIRLVVIMRALPVIIGPIRFRRFLTPFGKTKKCFNR